ncbi:hypothetical protein K2P56_01160 [Patescibacteria group bacterium]|nr:hypothetical protein [Patescibacteria group bacterium]
MKRIMDETNPAHGIDLKSLSKSQLRQLLDGALQKIQEINEKYPNVTAQYSEIERAHGALFSAENPLALKAETATEDIEKYRSQLDSEIKPEIQTTRNELTGLLSSTTLATLANAYEQAKTEYSRVPLRKYEGKILSHIFTFFYNTVWRNLDFFFSYAFFVAPLLAICFIFLYEDTAKVVLDTLTTANSVPTALELIYIKTIISLPLIWIAWYGQRNISQRKRMFEEYNHKLRVVQMYTMFTSDDTSYRFSDNQNSLKLETLLIDTIGNNASKVFGMDETILDKIKEIIRANKGGAEEKDGE